MGSSLVLCAVSVGAAVLLGSCAIGEEDAPSPPGALALTEDTTTTTSDGPSSTTTTTTTTVASTTTADPAPTVIEPDDLDVESHPIIDLVVRTSPGNDLNVRYGPGVEHEIASTLSHLTGGITSEHSVEIESGAIWRLITVDAEPLGWAHSDFLVDPEDTSLCTAGDDFPTFDTPLAEAEADVDLDGSPDRARLFVESSRDGSAHRAWVSLFFGNGGHATGHWPGAFEPSAEHTIEVLDLSHEGEPLPELLITTAAGSSLRQTGVMAFAQCEVVATTIAGSPFAFATGQSAGRASSAGCFTDSAGRAEFIVTVQDSDSWNKVVHELIGVTWSVVDRFDSTDIPGLTEPGVPILSDCS